VAVSDLTDPSAVNKALDEFDHLGRDAFLKRYCFGPSIKFFLVSDGKRYDSKAILGATHGFQPGSQGPLLSTEFSGGAQTVLRLQQLGFTIINADAEELPSGRIFGEIPGQPEGTTYTDREEVHTSGVHRPLQAGISYSEREGADSIIVSGGYEDDEDYGT
jgi:putative restriction endonuclease